MKSIRLKIQIKLLKLKIVIYLIKKFKSDCIVGEKCQNRRFRLRQYALIEKFKTSWGGFGLRAKQGIKAGDFVIEYVGEIIDLKESKRRLDEDAKHGKYFL